MTTLVDAPGFHLLEKLGILQRAERGAWRVLNWLNTVIRTMPITSQIAIFLNMLFKVRLSFPQSGSVTCDSSADRPALQTAITRRQGRFLPRASR
jgi:hypothetical protein